MKWATVENLFRGLFILNGYACGVPIINENVLYIPMKWKLNLVHHREMEEIGWEFDTFDDGQDAPGYWIIREQEKNK